MKSHQVAWTTLTSKPPPEQESFAWYCLNGREMCLLFFFVFLFSTTYNDKQAIQSKSINLICIEDEMLRGLELLKVFIPGYRATIFEDNTVIIFSETFI